MTHRKTIISAVLLVMILVTACGPDTIFLRPGLDTPAQHVKNGHSLLSRGKIDAASAEFSRAINLNARYSAAYIGIALVKGHQGEFEAGFESLNQAESLATTQEEKTAVEHGYKQLYELQSN